MIEVQLNRPMCDYCTFTSYSSDTWKTWKMMLGDMAERIESSREDAALYQYAGWRIKRKGYGSCFLGSGLQSGNNHFILSVSGAISDHVYLSDGVDGSKCTRIDFQVTVEQPDDYSARAIEKAAVGQGIEPVYWPSADGKLTTIYFGNIKGSDNVFTRLYQKMGGDDKMYLRIECCFRGKKAAAAHNLAKSGKAVGGIIAAAAPDVKEVRDIFRDVLAERIPVKVARVPHNTESWLKKTVFPSFTRYINDHDADPDIEQMFFDAVSRKRRLNL